MNQAMSHLERRVHPRVGVKMSVLFRLLDVPEGQANPPERRKERKAHTVNVSLGGLFLVPEDLKLVNGSLLSLDLFLPDKTKALNAMAETVRNDGAGSGLSFLAFQLEDRESLKAYLEGILPGVGNDSGHPSEKGTEQLRIFARPSGLDSSVTVVELEGTLDMNTAEAFDQLLQKLVQEKKCRIVLNLRGLSYISSMGMGILLGVIREIRNKNGDIKIAEVQPGVYRVFEILEADRFFQFLKTEQDAVSAF